MDRDKATTATGDQARSKRRKARRRAPTRGQRLVRMVSQRGMASYIWLLRLSCRIEIVAGGEHLESALASGQPVVPCAWHQRLVPSGLFLRSLVDQGMNVGFLISPSREGDFMSRVAHNHRVIPIRGSSSRTGREAMQALTAAVAEGISPMMYGDGPRGPARVFKTGAVILASQSGAPLLLVGAASSRFWQVKSWDRFQVPMPFCRFRIALGEPWPIGPLHDRREAETIAEELGRRLDALCDVARHASP